MSDDRPAVLTGTLTLDQRTELGAVGRLLDELSRRDGPLNHRELNAYARRIGRSFEALTKAHADQVRLHASVWDSLLQSRTERVDQAQIALYWRIRAESWNPIPSLRGAPVSRWVPLLWDTALSPILRGLIRAVSSLLRGLR